MADLGIYTKATVYKNAKLLAEESDLSIKHVGGGTRTFTVAKGFSGLTPGAAYCEGTIKNMVPVAGFEYDATPDIQGYTVVELTAFAAGSTLTIKAFIETSEFTHAVNTSSGQTLAFVGQYGTWD